jgi:hypothetical protein
MIELNCLLFYFQTNSDYKIFKKKLLKKVLIISVESLITLHFSVKKLKMNIYKCLRGIYERFNIF